MIVYKGLITLLGKNMNNFLKIAVISLILFPAGLYAADDEVEEVVVTGS